MFFVVDVETTGLTPWTGNLLTVAIVPVSEEGDIVEEDFYYRRLNHHAVDPRIIQELRPEDLTDTHKFWLDQEPSTIDEAYNKAPRISGIMMRQEISRYVSRIEPDKSKRFLAANPAAFDKMWLESLYGPNYNEEWPFHYRNLCLRSFRYGLEVSNVYGSSKGAQESEVPHHALHDAIAEARDLVYLLNLKRRIHEIIGPIDIHDIVDSGC